MVLALRELAAVAGACGLVAVGARRAAGPLPAAERFEAALTEFAKVPAYLHRNLDRRLDPRVQQPGTHSVISVAMRYRTSSPPPFPDDGVARGRVAAYAIGPDYHHELHRRLARMVDMLIERGLLRANPAGEDPVHLVCVDTAPVLEKGWAAAAGLGWQGKHSNLVSRAHGSWLLLAELLTPDEVEESSPARDHCGSCSRCIDACPTDALHPDRPYRLQVDQCISFLTLEERGSIDVGLREAIGDWLFGCDLCLDVCPFNRFADQRSDAAAPADLDLWYPPLLPILQASKRALIRRAKGSALSYVGPRQWRRNALIVAGNLLRTGRVQGPQARELHAELRRQAAEAGSELLREHARWALSAVPGLHSDPDLIK